MPNQVNDLLDTIEKKVPALKPWRMLLAACITSAVIGFGAAMLLSRSEVAGLMPANGALKEQVELYKAKLQVGSPEEALKKLNDLEARLQALQPKPDRRLLPEQKKALATALAPIAKEINGLSVVYEGTAEEARFAVDFINAMREMHIEAYGPTPGWGPLPTDKGILVGLRDPQKPSALALRFIDALRQAGLEISTTYWAGDTGGMDFDLFIAGQ